MECYSAVVLTRNFRTPKAQESITGQAHFTAVISAFFQINQVDLGRNFHMLHRDVVDVEQVESIRRLGELLGLQRKVFEEDGEISEFVRYDLHWVLYEDKKPSDAIRDLMGRPARHESEVIWLLSGKR